MVAPDEYPVLEPGDVVHHPLFGFAMVDGVDPDGGGASLDWIKPNPSTPTALRPDELSGPYRLCTPWGFLARSVRVPAGLRAFTREEPLTALRLLLEDLREPLEREQIRRWLLDRDLLEEREFPEWWDQVAAQLEAHDRFTRDEGMVRYTPDENLEAIALGDLQGAARTFLAQSPAGRFRMFRVGSPPFLEAVLDAAVRKRDIAAILLALRGRTVVPERHAERLEELALTGDPWLSAALVVRRHAPMEQALAKAAASATQRPLLRKTFAALARSQRVPAVVRLLDRAVAGEGGDVAAAYLVDEMMGGASVILHAIEQGGVNGQPPSMVARAWPRAHQWLRDRGEDATLERPSAPTAPLLTEVRPLTLDRLWPLSISLARALSERHAEGRAGGVRSARVGPSDEILLGAPEDTETFDDVRTSMRTLAQLLVGTLPRGTRVPDNELLAHLPRLVPGIPSEWVAVLTRSLSADPVARPKNGLDLWEQLACAAALAQVRLHAPRRTTAKLDVGHDSHIGLLKSRLGQINQDAVFFHVEDNVAMLIVADGISVSTAGSGNLASAILVQAVVSKWEQEHEDLVTADDTAVREFLVSALAEGNTAVCEAALQLAGGDLSRHIPMGTTVLVAVCRGAEIVLAQLGDSRAYLVSSAGAAQITSDQNLLDEWLTSWQDGHPIDLISDGHALVGYVGHFDERGRPDPVTPAIHDIRLLPGETLLLTTDGLTDYATDSPAELASMIEEAAAMPDLGSACRRLVDHANAGGGGDNITLILARCVRG